MGAEMWKPVSMLCARLLVQPKAKRLGTERLARAIGVEHASKFTNPLDSGPHGSGLGLLVLLNNSRTRGSKAVGPVKTTLVQMDPPASACKTRNWEFAHHGPTRAIFPAINRKLS